MEKILTKIVCHDMLHARWLNTLSFMENMGARKISACEDSTHVSIVQLKHAAEEHRHAYYLKKQIKKIAADICPSYQMEELLAAVETRQYLKRLDNQVSRYMKKTFQLSGAELKYAGYLFVTYVIEVRADLLYPVYQDVLTRSCSKVMVKSIILEEEGHLEEMIAQLSEFDVDWQRHADRLLSMEHQLFHRWVLALEQDIHRYEAAVGTDTKIVRT